MVGSLRFVARGFAALVLLVVAVLPFVGEASAAPPKHRFRTWSPQEALGASPHTGSEAARNARPADPRAARAFADRAEGAVDAIRGQLGAQFVSAALDPVAGNRLVVRVTGSGVSSAALEALDRDGSEVVIVENQPSLGSFETELAQAQALAGTKLGSSTVRSVARDDLAGKVVIGVDTDVEGATRALAGRFTQAVVTTVPDAVPADCSGGTCQWGNNPVRNQAPVRGGIAISSIHHGCTATMPATRGGAAVMITAGHCVEYNETEWVNGSGTVIGAPILKFNNDSAQLDAAVVANATTSSNCILLGSGGCIPIAPKNTVLLQGDPVSKTGATTGDTNGTVLSTDVVSGTGGNSHFIQSNAYSDHGDSGGVLYRDNGGAADVLGITSYCFAQYDDGPCLGTGGGWTNWRVACPALGVDNCPSAFTNTPIGGVDTPVALDNQDIHVTGWAIDPDRPGGWGLTLGYNVDGVWLTPAKSTVTNRSDVPAGYAGNVGFDVHLSYPFGSGTRNVCVYALNASGSAGFDNWIGCRTVNLVPNLAYTDLVGVPSAKLAVSRHLDGRLEAVRVNANGAVQHKAQTTANGSWPGSWTAFSGLTNADRVAIGRAADGRLEVFAVTTAGAVWHRYQTTPLGTAWSAWEAMSNPNPVRTGADGAFVVGRNADDRLEIFVATAGGNVEHLYQLTANGSWSTWEQLPRTGATGVAVARNQDGRLELFSTSTNGDLQHAWQSAPNTAFGAWSSMGNAVPYKFAALARNADGRLEVFTIGRDNGMIDHNFQLAPNYGWGSFATMSAPSAANSLAIQDNADGRLELFAVMVPPSGNRYVAHAFQAAPNYGWSTWSSTSSNGNPTSIAMAVNSDGRQEAFADTTTLSTTQHAYQNAVNTPFSAWIAL